MPVTIEASKSTEIIENPLISQVWQSTKKEKASKQYEAQPSILATESDSKMQQLGGLCIG